MKIFKKLVLVLVGVILLGLGIAINLANNWGSDPVTVFAHSISLKFAGHGIEFFTVGNVLIALNLIVFAVIVAIDKMKYVNVGTFAGMFLVGIFSDLWLKLLGDAVSSHNEVYFKVLWLVLGTVILSTGIGLYVASEMGASPLDLISVSISDHFKNLKYPRVRMTCDIIFGVLGWILGGVVGFTTVACMLFIGPISGFVIRNIKKCLGL